MTNPSFESIVNSIIAKHHINVRNPKKRLQSLKKLAKQYQFNEKIQGKVIHIAGTNGKGSTQQFLWDLLKAQGYSCHIIRSPHLTCYNERIYLNNQMIDDQTFLDALQWADSVVEPPISISVITLAFFKCCLDNPADFILLETGLGGVYDITNILDDHTLSIITPISYDHCDLLGDTLEEIATAKAGIMRPNRLCLSANQAPEVKHTLLQHAKDLHTPISFLEEHAYQRTADGFLLHQQPYPQPGLIGEHQKDNAALALLAYQNLIDTHIQLSHQQINQALQNTYFAGRLHPINPGKLTQQLNHNLWIDGAHNPAGAQQLISFLQQQDQPIYFWLNFKNNKDIKKILEITQRHPQKIIFQITNATERATEQAIKNITDKLNLTVSYSDRISLSIKTLNQQPKGLVLAFGSLHWIGRLLQLNKHYVSDD